MALPVSAGLVIKAQSRKRICAQSKGGCMKIENVTIAGAGTLGSQIAWQTAFNGYVDQIHPSLFQMPEKKPLVWPLVVPF